MRHDDGGSRAAFERLIAGNTDRLLRTAYLLCYDLYEAEDLVQETWTRVARRWPKIAAAHNPIAYVRRILVNVAIDGQPARARRRTELSDALPDRDDQGAERAFERIDSFAELSSILAKLPLRQRAVLVLRYWEDLPEKEVAHLLGCSVGTVKSTASRALSELRAIEPRHPATTRSPHVRP